MLTRWIIATVVALGITLSLAPDTAQARPRIFGGGGYGGGYGGGWGNGYGGGWGSGYGGWGSGYGRGYAYGLGYSGYHPATSFWGYTYGYPGDSAASYGNGYYNSGYYPSGYAYGSGYPGSSYGYGTTPFYSSGYDYNSMPIYSSDGTYGYGTTPAYGSGFSSGYNSMPLYNSGSTYGATPAYGSIDNGMTPAYGSVIGSVPLTSGQSMPQTGISSTSGYTPSPDAATLDVVVPDANAEVLVDGQPTTQRGLDRQFVSPPLEQGHSYSYQLTCRWSDGSGQHEKTKNVNVSRGQTVRADFASGADRGGDRNVDRDRDRDNPKPLPRLNNE